MTLKEYQKEWYRRNKERVSARRKEQYENNREYHIERTKNNALKRKYGMTLSDKQKMIEAQNSNCAICFKDLQLDKFSHVDHDHATGKIRQILCSTCNTGLGCFKEDTIVLQKAIDYLKKHEDDQNRQALLEACE
jgi:hypothetical protein